MGEGPIPPISRFLCRILPGCNEDTVSAEVARRLGTTLQGAHAFMLAPLITLDPVSYRAVILTEAKFALAQRGSEGIDAMLRFMPSLPQLPLTQTLRNELIRKANKARREEAKLRGPPIDVDAPETARIAIRKPLPRVKVSKGPLSRKVGKLDVAQLAVVAQGLANELDAIFCERVRACLKEV